MSKKPLPRIITGAVITTIAAAAVLTFTRGEVPRHRVGVTARSERHFRAISGGIHRDAQLARIRRRCRAQCQGSGCRPVKGARRHVGEWRRYDQATFVDTAWQHTCSHSSPRAGAQSDTDVEQRSRWPAR